MKIGIITFTDGRKRAADMLEQQCREFQSKLANHLRGKGHEPVEGQSIAWNYATAMEEAGRMNEADVDVVLFNFCVWAYPDFAAQAARDVQAPICFVGNVNPAYPGWVAFFAAAGALDEFGVPFGRVLGDVSGGAGHQLDAWLDRYHTDNRERGYAAAAKLMGQRYGEFDGPSMGMYTGHIDPSQWMEQFGVHVFHRSQLTLAWLTDQVSDDRVEAGLRWMEEHCGEVRWNDDRLARGVNGHLGKQLRFYLAVKDYCKLEGLDFLGLTGQLDYTEWKDGITMDVPEALLNDIADWEGDKKPLICATECDSNGALTMQIMHLLSGTPVLFADLRHHFEEQDVYDLVNSGEHAPWFATGTDDVKANWKAVTLHPSNAMYFPNGGASVEFLAAPQDKVTFARLTRNSGRYRMHFFTGSFVRFGDEIDRALASQTSPEWPHAFARFDCSRHDLAQQYSSNHIHAILGDWMGELQAVCDATGIEPYPMS